jgi:hypothetical protein
MSNKPIFIHKLCELLFCEPSNNGRIIFFRYGAWRSEIATHHVTRHNTPIHSSLSTAPQLSISQKALGTLPDDGNVMPKHVGSTYIINKQNE